MQRSGRIIGPGLAEANSLSRTPILCPVRVTFTTAPDAVFDSEALGCAWAWALSDAASSQNQKD